MENRCDAPIEVDIDDVADPVALGYEHEWKVVPSGETATLRSAPDPLKSIYVWVRSRGTDVVPAPLVFESSELQTSDHKVVSVIVDDLCPT